MVMWQEQRGDSQVLRGAPRCRQVFPLVFSVQPTTVLLPRVGRYSVLTKSQRSKIQKTVKRKCGGIVIPFLTSARPQLPVTTGDGRPLVRGRDSLVSRRDCCLSPDFFSLSHPILRRTPRNRRVRPTVRGLSPERGEIDDEGDKGD